MELTNEFRVGVPPATAWTVLTDVERIAPCMPGAQLQEVEGGTLLTVVESGFDSVPPSRRLEAFRMNSQGWEAQMGNLQKHVATP